METNLTNINNEAELVNRCRRNDRQAQKVLYVKYVEDMMLICLRYITSTEDAKEVLMDGFLAFFTQLKKFEYVGQGSLKAWLKKIMVNQCLMHLRKRKMSFHSIDDGYNYIEVATDDNALEALTVKEIITLVNRLPNGCKVVFNLYVFEGKTHKEIAEWLDITEGTSKSQLHHARTLLKQQLLQQA